MLKQEKPESQVSSEQKPTEDGGRLVKKVAQEVVDSQYYAETSQTTSHRRVRSWPRLSIRKVVFGVFGAGLGVAVALSVWVGFDYFAGQGQRVKENEWLPASDEAEISLEDVLKPSEATEAAELVSGNSREAWLASVRSDEVVVESSSKQDMRAFLLEILVLRNRELMKEEFTFDVLYDARQFRGEGFDYANKFNQDYYLLASAGLLVDGRFEGEGGVMVDLKRVDDQLVESLVDPKFCQSDDECVIRGNFCTYGAFNQYQVYVEGWKCVVNPVSEADETFGVFDKTAGCVTQLEFTRAKCEQNRCVGEDKQITCQKPVATPKISDGNETSESAELE